MARKTATPSTVRPLNVIAREVLADPAYQRVAWKAQPYVSAMRTMTTTADRIGADGGVNVVIYALSNLDGQYRGETAKRVKAELRAHLDGATVTS